jgi:predicted dehydrogenase
MRKIRFGIVGCGMVFKSMFGPIFKYLDSGECVAVMDTDIAAAKWVRQHYGINEVYSNFREMLQRSNIEAVIIGSPVFAHKEQVIESAKAGMHVFCEKPMARTVSECQQLIDACKQHNAILMVGFMKRFNRCFKLVKQMIEAGELGDVFQVRTEWSWHQYRKEKWRDSLSTLGGIFQDHGSHVTDLCRWWLGEIETVSGEINILLKDREVEDQATALYRHRNGSISLHHHTRMTHMPLGEYYQICGTKGTLEMEYGPGWSFVSSDPFKMTLHKNGASQTEVTPFNKLDPDAELRRNNQYLKELEHFCSCIAENKTPLVGGIDGLKAIEAINAVYLSSWKKEKIHLPVKDEFDLESLFKQIKTGA